jgi:hypothetical protein
MKNRLGFVSNSSASSFVVRLPNEYDTKHGLVEPSMVATDDDVRKLLEYGFLPIGHCHASQLNEDSYKEGAKPGDEGVYALGYNVSCNQDEVIDFLTENDIPFEASCHYGDEAEFYKRGEDSILVLQNFGLQYETHSTGYIAEWILKDAGGGKRIPKSTRVPHED